MTSTFHGAPYPLRLLVLPVDGHAHASVAQYAASMARSFAREGDSVYLAITPEGWCVPFEREEPMQFVAWQSPQDGAAGSPARRPERARAFAIEAARTLVRSVQPECVLFVAGYAGHGAAILEGVAAAGVPTAVVVLDAHDPHASADARPMFIRRKALAHAWVATTAHAQRVLARRLECPPGALEVCPEGAPLQPQTPSAELQARRAAVHAALGLPADAVIVVSRGRLDEGSGCLDWAEALAGVSVDYPAARFIWLGHGPLQNSVANILRHTPAAGRVQLLREAVAPAGLEQVADLAIFADRASRPGLAIGRAMTAGVPLIATAVDPVLEIVRHMREGLICAKANPPSLVESLRYALAHPAAMRAMANAAYLRIQDYSEERAVGSLRPLLERLSMLRGVVRSPGQGGG